MRMTNGVYEVDHRPKLFHYEMIDGVYRVVQDYLYIPVDEVVELIMQATGIAPYKEKDE